MGNIWSQMYPPAPVFTEKELGDLKGRVLLVTGGYAGVGCELVKLVYAKKATVYVAGRSEEKAKKAVSDIKAAFPDSKGRLEFLLLDLGDLTNIKKTAEEFLSKEQRLDVLWNNAGVMVPPKGSKTTLPNSSFPSSAQLQRLPHQTPKGGIDWADINKGQPTVYSQSKAGNLYLGAEMARRTKGEGILSSVILHPSIYGGYTELYAGLSPDLTEAHNGAYILPWGHIGRSRADIMEGSKSEEDGRTVEAKKFWRGGGEGIYEGMCARVLRCDAGV